MDKQREEGYQARYLLSCCGIMVLDGDGNVIGHLIYNVDKDYGLPIKCEEKNSQRLCKFWKESKEPLKPMDRKYLCILKESCEGPRLQMCVIRDCACNTPIVRKIPKEWIKIRYGLNWIRFQEYFAQFEAPLHYEDEDEAPPAPAKIVSVDDPGLEWKKGWSCTNFALASKLFKMLHRKVTPGPEMSGDEGAVMARSYLEMLPLEVYEVLAEDLDGLSLLNMCNSSPKIEKRILEPFLYYQPRKGMAKWFEYCSRDLHRPTVIKILSSFDTLVRPLKIKEGPQESGTAAPTWEMIFKCYQHYWSTLLGNNVRVQNFTKFETQLKGEMLVTSQSYDSAQFYRKTFSGGGKMLCNIMFPSISEYDTTNTIVIEDYEKVDCRNSATLCETSTLPKLFAVKLAYLPNVSSNVESPFSPPPVSKVLISACYKCVTTIPLQGGTGRTLDLQLEGVTEEELARQRHKPIIEVHSNIIALWLAPEHLLFLAVNQTEVEEQIAYGIVLLYRLQVPQMTLLWDRLEELREDYLPIIREYKGRTVLLNDNVERELRDFNRAGPLPMGQAEPTFYGLALVSPLYGIECLKPKEDLDVGAWESLDPQYYSANARPHLSSFREWSCSGKGFGLFVFCNDKSLAVSWNGLNWIFGSVKLLLSTIAKTENKQSVAYVEVIYDNGLLLVVNDTTILLELALITKKPEIVEGVNVAEPELRINPLRAFPLGLCSMEISQFELNFDMGKPFFFIICEKKPILLKDKDGSKWRSDDYGFRMKRVDFLCDD